jgi:hypothetical protein
MVLSLLRKYFSLSHKRLFFNRLQDILFNIPMQVIDFFILIGILTINVGLLCCEPVPLEEKMMSIKTSCSRLCKHLTGKKLRILVIRAGFPYHKDPLLYHWLWVFIMLPFLDEDSLNDLSEKHGKPNDKNSLFKPVLILSEKMPIRQDFFCVS